MTPLRLSDAPSLTDRSVRSVYIKDGRRKMMSDTGHMYMPADLARKLFGRLRGGKYSLKQHADN